MWSPLESLVATGLVSPYPKTNGLDMDAENLCDLFGRNGLGNPLDGKEATLSQVGLCGARWDYTETLNTILHRASSATCESVVSSYELIQKLLPLLDAYNPESMALRFIKDWNLFLDESYDAQTQLVKNHDAV